MKNGILKNIEQFIEKTIFSDDFNYKNALFLKELCEKGDIEQFKINYNPQNSHNDYNTFLLMACWNWQADMYEFLLTIPEVRNNSLVQNNFSEHFVASCVRENLQLIKYICSDDFPGKEHLDIYQRADEGFKLAAKSGNIDVMKFLIFDMKYKISEELEHFLKTANEFGDAKEFEEVMALIEKKKLETNLLIPENRLAIDKRNTSKI